MPAKSELSILLEQQATDRHNGVEIPHFTTGNIKALEKKGIDMIYNLSGKSIREQASQQRNKGKFWSLFDENPIWDMTAEPIQIAVSSSQPTILYSHRSMGVQKKLIREFPKERGIHGVKGIMPEAPHVVELLLLHLQEADERLLNTEQGIIFARTKTPAGKTSAGKDLFASVGCYHPEYGLRVRYDTPHKNPNIVALPLLVPA